MNIHNDLYYQYISAKIGSASILKAYEKGYIDSESFNVIMALTPNYTIEQIIEYKSDEFNYFCDKAISAGIDVELGDGSKEHFSLTSDDQININTALTQIMMGTTEIEYHADGGPFKVYSSQDMLKICLAAQGKTRFETAYRNNLREWIKQLKDVEEIRKITYGVPIPEEYWTEGWRSIQEKIEKQKAEELKKQTASSSDEPQAQSDDVPVEEPKENILTKAVNAVTGKSSKKKKATAKEEPNE